MTLLYTRLVGSLDKQRKWSHLYYIPGATHSEALPHEKEYSSFSWMILRDGELSETEERHLRLTANLYGRGDSIWSFADRQRGRALSDFWGTAAHNLTNILVKGDYKSFNRGINDIKDRDGSCAVLYAQGESLASKLIFFLGLNKNEIKLNAFPLLRPILTGLRRAVNLYWAQRGISKDGTISTEARNKNLCSSAFCVKLTWKSNHAQIRVNSPVLRLLNKRSEKKQPQYHGLDETGECYIEDKLGDLPKKQVKNLSEDGVALVFEESFFNACKYSNNNEFPLMITSIKNNHRVTAYKCEVTNTTEIQEIAENRQGLTTNEILSERIGILYTHLLSNQSFKVTITIPADGR